MAREHARAFADVPGVSIGGIHSRTRARAEQLAGEFGIPAVCDSIAELYERVTPDLVVVAVPELAMRAVSRQCFDFPWTILLEKPPGYNLTDAEAIHTAATAARARAFVALNRRFYGCTRMVLADLSASEGRRFIKVQDQEDTVAALAAGQPPEVVANWMYGNSIHLIDYFRLFGRGPIAATESIVRWQPENPNVVVTRIDFASGDVGIYEGIWNAPGPWAVTVVMPSMRWELRPLEQGARQRRGERLLEPMQCDPRDVHFKPGLRLQAEMAVAAALGRPHDCVEIADALETMRLISRIFEAPLAHLPSQASNAIASTS